MNSSATDSRSVVQLNDQFWTARQEIKSETWMSHVSPEEDIVMGISLALICIISAYANTVIIIGLMRRNKNGLLEGLDILLGNLTVSNLLLAVMTFPFVVISAFNHGWVFGTSGCDAYGFGTLMFGLTSIFTLLGIAAILHASTTSDSFSSGKTNQARLRCLSIRYLFMVYTIAFVLSVFPLIGVGNYGLGKHGFSCNINWANRSATSSIYVTTLFLLGFFTPLFGTVVAYAKIIILLQQIRKKSKCPQLAARWYPVQTKTLSMGFSVTSAFLLCWMPYAVISMLETYGDPATISPRLEGCSAFLAKSSTLCTPVVHLLFNKNYRNWILVYLCCNLSHTQCDRNPQRLHRILSARARSSSCTMQLSRCQSRSIFLELDITEIPRISSTDTADRLTMPLVN